MQKLSTTQYNALASVLKKKGYKFFFEGLTLVGIRLNHEVTNRFDDTLVALYDGTAVAMDCTTDPGSYYMKHPMTDKGTAILAPGQYKYKIGFHKGQYEALVQAEPVTVYRDNNKDGTYDYEHPEIGMFGINIHRANKVVKSKQVDKWSAGCTVVADPADFAHLLSLAHKSTALYGETIPYILIDEEALESD